MLILQQIFLFIIAVGIVCGVILIAIPLFKMRNFQKRSHRPYLVLKKKNNTLLIKNNGDAAAKILNIFLEPESKYFDSLNDFTFVPGQTAKLSIPEEQLSTLDIELTYIDIITNQTYKQRYPLSIL